jgi:hypothetical protein
MVDIAVSVALVLLFAAAFVVVKQGLELHELRDRLWRLRVERDAAVMRVKTKEQGR